ncbi:hypothetical protein B566_EDAN008152 [Ephemera danica]|nr:hypothetical protein B566_EDAN008152 [Ephemera danica]
MVVSSRANAVRTSSRETSRGSSRVISCITSEHNHRVGEVMTAHAVRCLFLGGHCSVRASCAMGCSKIFAVTAQELKQPGFFIKFIEIGCLMATTMVARLGRNGHPLSFHKGSVDADTLGRGVCISYLIITPVLLLGYILGEVGNQRRKMELIFNGVGAILFLLCGSMSVDFWRAVGLVPFSPEPRFWERLLRSDLLNVVNTERNAGIALGCLTLCSGFLFLLDALFAYRLNRVKPL